MKHSQEAGYLIKLLRAALSNEEPETPNILLNWEWVHEIASRHKISQIVYNGILKLPKKRMPSHEILDYFVSDADEAKKQNKMQTEEVGRLLVFFKKEQIPSTLLFDWPMKDLYELPEMREVNMIHFLVKVPIDERVDKLMNSLGYDILHKGIASTIYSNDPMIKIRLHNYLFWKDEEFKQYFAATWNRLELIEEQEYIYRFSLEDFYILYIAYLWNQCRDANADIRPFLDLWLYTEYCIEELDWEYIQSELEKLCISTFHYRVMQLVECWFEKEKSSENIVEEFGKFVIQSGNFQRKQTIMLIGIAKNLRENDIAKAKKAYIKERLFLDRKEMKENYKTLQKRPYLLPFYRIKRLLGGVFFNFKKSAEEYKQISQMNEKDIKKMSLLIKGVGLDKDRVRIETK